MVHDGNAVSTFVTNAADDFEGEARHAFQSIESGARNAMAHAERAIRIGPLRGSSSGTTAEEGGLEGMAEIEQQAPEAVSVPL